MTENIMDMVRKVVLLRSLAAAAKKHRLELLAAWEKEWEKEHAPLLDAEALNTSLLAEAEAALRTEAIRVFQETGSKTPGPGLGIRQDLESILREIKEGGG